VSSPNSIHEVDKFKAVDTTNLLLVPVKGCVLPTPVPVPPPVGGAVVVSVDFLHATDESNKIEIAS
jgi:hypothetical protein